ncbi:MAG: AzlD domain-containing protein [Clostridia bacterium]|nr:AzlD domain-containing protein [Clostridia bacterium]
MRKRRVRAVHNIYVYILIMGGVSYLIRMLPLTLIKKEITNRFIKSFLYYVPYVTLAVMTFPAIIEATKSPLSGAIALAAGIILSFIGANLIQVAGACCAVVFICELIIR